MVNGSFLVTRDTTANWNEHLSFIPLRGEVIIYTDHGSKTDGEGNTVYIPGVKIGDGTSYLADIAFVGEDMRNEVLAALGEHAADTDIHVTTAEKEFWNNKLNCTVNGETLILNRN